MEDKNLLDCCQTILDFLQEDYHLIQGRSSIPTPKQEIMNNTLSDNGWNNNMIRFTEYLNNLFQLGYQIEDTKTGSYKPFFSTQAEGFYKKIIRNLKLKQLNLVD
jgi:hypothetical protein